MTGVAGPVLLQVQGHSRTGASARQHHCNVRVACWGHALTYNTMMAGGQGHVAKKPLPAPAHPAMQCIDMPSRAHAGSKVADAGTALIPLLPPDPFTAPGQIAQYWLQQKNPSGF